MSLPSNVISQRVITTRVVHFNFLPVCCRMSSSAVRKSPLINWDSSAYLPAFVTLTNNRNSTRATLAPWNNDVPLTNHRRSPQVMLTPRNNEVPEMVKRMMAFPPPPFFFARGEVSVDSFARNEVKSIISAFLTMRVMARRREVMEGVANSNRSNVLQVCMSGIYLANILIPLVGI